jgi:hypothetical protein
VRPKSLGRRAAVAIGNDHSGAADNAGIADDTAVLGGAHSNADNGA